VLFLVPEWLWKGGCQLLMLAWAASCMGNWEGTQPGQLTTANQRDIPCHMMSCSASKVGGKKKEGGDGQSDRVYLPK